LFTIVFARMDGLTRMCMRTNKLKVVTNRRLLYAFSIELTPSH